MEKEKCSNCYYYQARENYPDRCRRTCPAIGWRVVREDDWCGEWKNKKGQTKQEVIEAQTQVLNKILNKVTPEPKEPWADSKPTFGFGSKE